MSQQAVPKKPVNTSRVEALLIRLGATKKHHPMVVLIYTRIRNKTLKSRSGVILLCVIHVVLAM